MALTFLDRPGAVSDIWDIWALASAWKQAHQKRIAQHQEDEPYFHLTYYVPSPDMRSPLMSPSGYQVVEELINHTIAQSPIITVYPVTPDEREVVRAGRETAWLAGFWQTNNLARLQRQWLWHDAVRGCHVCQMVYDPYVWPLEPKRPVAPAEPPDLWSLPTEDVARYADDLDDYHKKRSSYLEDLAAWTQFAEENLPIRVMPLDPKFCLWEPTDDPEQIVIQSEWSVEKVVQLFPEARDYVRHLKPGSKVKFCQYWNRTHVAYWIEPLGGLNLSFWDAPGAFQRSDPRPRSYQQMGQRPIVIQEPTRHGYNFFPFSIDGPWLTPLEDPDKRFPSIYYAIKPMIQYESTLLTQMAHVIKVAAWAPLIMTTDLPQGKEPILNMTPGKQNTLREGTTVSFLDLPPGTVSVLSNLIGEIDQYIQKGAGLADVLRGNTKGRSGYQQAQLAAMAKVALVPVEQCTIRTIQHLSRMALRMIDHIGMKVPVQSAGAFREPVVAALGPKDVARIGRIDVTLRSVLPIDEGARIANLIKMQEAGWISGLTAARMAAVENPEEEASRRAAEEIVNQPEVKKSQAMLFLQEHWPEMYLMVMNLESAQQQQQGQQEQVRGPGGAGGGPQLGQPSRSNPNAPGGEQEMGMTIRQGAQGGRPPARLPAGDAGE